MDDITTWIRDYCGKPSLSTSIQLQFYLTLLLLASLQKALHPYGVGASRMEDQTDKKDYPDSYHLQPQTLQRSEVVSVQFIYTSVMAALMQKS